MSAPAVRTGLDRLVSGDAAAHLRGAAAGLILHPASVTANLRLSVDALIDAGFSLRCLFGPQHGARGEKQDNMVESDHYVDSAAALPVHSLYSEVRSPTREMLAHLDVLLFDLQDVGVRVYTFAWTMALAMEACAREGIRFVVLDRPNPVGGVVVEGPVLRAGFESFVGLHPIPLRHGLTTGELARWLNAERGIGCDLEVVAMEGWHREMRWPETGLPWVLPSPNLPTPASCDVYPGMVLVEGTNLSEGRGTTKPFELVGAPWLDPRMLANRMDSCGLPGVAFRGCSFEPTFQKHAGRLCGGVQLHVTDPGSFRPVRTAVELFSAARDLAPTDFDWRPPPYEYEERLMPIDILWGHDGLRRGVDAGASAEKILEGVEDECDAFASSAESYRLYG
ncbi:MAG: DUF1343 domain-containing protein [Gemmatimonadetes bacterium]|nr:DUF1343 domain-containing protein [Gemmatimonadota bacterium]